MSLGFFPVASSGYGWTGDADLGPGNINAVTPDYPTGRSQTGGWQYNLLPYIEQTTVHQMGAGLSGVAKRNEASKRANVVIAMFVCPEQSTLRYANGNPFGNAAGGASWPGYLARTDYFGCQGTGSGMIHPGGRFAHEVTDGMTNVFIAGHRFLNPLNYDSTIGQGGCVGEGWTVGKDWDNIGGTFSDGPEWGGTGCGDRPPARNFIPMRDTVDEPSCGVRLAGSCWVLGHPKGARFGGPHEAFPMAMADGSVHSLDYNIDVALFEKLGNVGDDGAIDDAAL